MYRGSRDGFGAVDFHSKCDNQPNTVTFIKTTSGFVFGGYIQVCWNSNKCFSSDPNAFIFTLVNKSKKPFICELRCNDYAIYNDPNFGPTFGAGYDIHVCDNSNASKDSELNLGVSYELIEENQFYFSDDLNFQVNEIEVFRIETI